MRVIIFRHGETDSNVKQIMQGAGIDTPLNKKGIQQAKALAEQAVSLGLEKIYSSPLRRALQTATLTASVCHLDVEPIDGVEEFHYGEVEGMYISEACEKFGIEKVYLDETNSKMYETCLPGGESINQCLARLMAALQKIKKENESNCHCVGVFSHGAAMRVLYYHFFKEHREFANCEWFEVDL